jgi:hypothetical protein
MLNKPPLLKLSLDEELFLRCWMYDEVHYQQARGPAKRLQLEHHVAPADLSVLIAAAMPEPAKQEAAALGPPPAELPKWPWTDELLLARLTEARRILAHRTPRLVAGACEQPLDGGVER